jgi:hypothetical protein
LLTFLPFRWCLTAVSQPSHHLFGVSPFAPLLTKTTDKG